MKSVLQIALPMGLGLSLALAGCAGEAEENAADTATESTGAEVTAVQSNIRDVSVAQASTLLSGEGNAVVLDVRTPAEFEAGHIEGALNADYMGDDFAGAIADLDREATYVLYCKSGARSAKALDVMKEQGFTDVAHLTEGYDGWAAAQASE